MGKAALLLVLGLSLAFAVIGKNLHKTGSMTAEFQTGYLKYATARNLARTAVHSRLRAIESGGSLTGRVTGSFNLGTFWTEIDSLGLDSLRMRARATFEDSVYNMVLVLKSYPKPFPGVNAAIGIRATPVNFSIAGKPEIDGRNYSEDGTTLVGSGNVSGVAVMKKADSTSVAQEGKVGTSTPLIKGDPPVKIDTTTANPAQYINEYRSAAHFTYGSGTYSADLTWGSASDPKIIVCETPDTNVSVHFSGKVKGYGILVIKGNVKMSGQFDFYGLVVVYGEDNIINIDASGNATLTGGLIMAGGAGSSLAIKGGGVNKRTVSYSSAALAKAQRIKTLTFYRVVNWYE